MLHRNHNKIVNNYYHKRREFINNFKRNKKCYYCDESDFRCLEFHHIDPQQKSFNLGYVVSKGYKTIEEEIKKCLLICANCHRKIEYDIRMGLR